MHCYLEVCERAGDLTVADDPRGAEQPDGLPQERAGREAAALRHPEDLQLRAAAAQTVHR